MTMQADNWEGWSPEKTGKTPHALQERHSPTTSATLRDAGGKQREACLRRLADARLWDAMTQAQQDAAHEIALACEVLGQGLGYASSNLERISGSRSNNALECRERLVAFYTLWTARCRQERISHSLVVDILVYGFSCRALDGDSRVRAGTARRNLVRGLALYCRMKGWPAH